MREPRFHRMFHYDRALLPNRHLAALEDGVTTIEQARKQSGATIGYPGWGLIYHLLLSHLARGHEEILIETGANWGCTTIVLAQALIDSGCTGRVVTFELSAENSEIAQRNLAAAGVGDRVELHQGDVHEVFAPAVSSLAGVRFAFLDASHLFDDVLFEFETLLPHLAPDALVLFDNTYAIAEEGEDPRVNGALAYILRKHGGNLVNLEYVSWFTPGLAIWQRAPAL
ncbi:MAG: class I SAM-dependent methyltransferase [Hyphomonadaceae bacterium]